MEYSVDIIEGLLPQTQCQQCGYKGCRPYAQALFSKQDTIDRCPPGGTETLFKLAKLLNLDPNPYLKNMQNKTKLPAIASIREEECIGCTKCIQVCPTDAIIGSAKLMHTIITKACTGCELCIEPCPVDCIEMLEAEPNLIAKKDYWRERHQHHLTRLNKKMFSTENQMPLPSLAERQQSILEAIARSKRKRKTGESGNSK